MKFYAHLMLESLGSILMKKKKQKVFFKIYQEVKKIPKGQTRTYKEIANKVGTTPRIVGFALHRNPDPKTIPCHRVIYSNGSLSKGYAFGGENIQRKKLQEEGTL